MAQAQPKIVEKVVQDPEAEARVQVSKILLHKDHTY